MALLNIDLGELPDEPLELYDLAHIANLACGGHAGDEASLDRSLAACRTSGARPGAHPSYPDREGFGRRRLPLPPAAIAASVADQCRLLARAAGRAGVAVTLLKPHGALYHAADEDEAIAAAVLDGAGRELRELRAVIGPAGGEMERAARARGLEFLREGFADRAEEEVSPGMFRLVPRERPGAVVDDPAIAARRARELTARCDTICVHGDGPNAVAVARAVRGVLG